MMQKKVSPLALFQGKKVDISVPKMPQNGVKKEALKRSQNHSKLTELDYRYFNWILETLFLRPKKKAMNFE